MTAYTIPELCAILVMDAAWKREPVEVQAKMVAIIPCESGGNPDAYNTVMGGHYGLTQISKSNWGYLFKQYDWRNPRDNLAMAHVVYVKQGFTAWSCYTNGSWLSYPRALHALKSEPLPVPPGVSTKGQQMAQPPLTPSVALPPGYEALEPTVADLAKLVAFIVDRQNWARVGLFLGGGVLVLVGLVGALGQSKVGRRAMDVASGVTPVGRAVDAAKAVT